MERDPAVCLMGIGVSDYKGIFGTTLEARERFNARVIEAPASENALTGIAIGMALEGKRPVLIHARNDFMFLALDQMINTASKWRYVYGGRGIPVVVRCIVGKGWGQGPTHSQSLQSVFAHFPGLRVAMPATPYDAKGMYIHALKQDGPSVIIEHRSLFGVEGVVPQAPYEVAYGQARVVRPGSDVTVVAPSVMLIEALDAASRLERDGVEAEVIDPRSISPLDRQTITDSVRKTGRLVCLDTSWTACGFSAEAAALAAERAWDSLKGPVVRIGMADCPCPVSKRLEDVFYPNARTVYEACMRAMGREACSQMSSWPERDDKFKGPY